MTRVITFVCVMCVLVLVVSLSRHSNLPISNSHFDYEKAKKKHEDHIAEVHALEKMAMESGKKKEVEVKKVVVPVIALDTPELKRGAELYKKCMSCHGKMGQGKKGNKAPKIAGQHSWYIVKSLMAMKSGARINKPMKPYLKRLNENDFKDLATYLAKLPW